MSKTSESDARALWDDVADIIQNHPELPSSLTAMVKACEPLSYDEKKTELVVGAPTRFMKRQLEKSSAQIESCLEEVAFSHVTLVVSIAATDTSAKPINTSSVMTEEEVNAMPSESHVSPAPQSRPSEAARKRVGAPNATSTKTPSIEERRAANPLVGSIAINDSKLTFDRFVEGEENMMALQAAKRVADGNRDQNPLFIYGKSGLGKTHLLKAIQNYIEQNNVEQLCVYRTSHDFVSDYVTAMANTTNEVKEVFRRNYQDIDVLIIDDVQFLKGSGTVGFFFDLFNYLKDHGKQIVLAADESPRMLGVGNADFDERMVSRFDSGLAYPIRTPDYELKYALVKNFYKREKEDAAAESLMGYEGTLSEENLQLMAERAGSNIRVIESFCQVCLLESSKLQRHGLELSRDDIIKIATQKFGASHHTVTIDEIQKAVEEEWGISHTDLVGSTRKKTVMEPRQIACYLSRSLTDVTLADIGKHFGGRSHATVYYSISEVEKQLKDDRLLVDRVNRLKDLLLNE